MKRTAFILPYKVIYSVRSNIEKITKGYTKIGPVTLGDNKVCVTEDETSIEVFNSAAITWIRKHFPEAREVTIIWE